MLIAKPVCSLDKVLSGEREKRITEEGSKIEGKCSIELGFTKL